MHCHEMTDKELLLTEIEKKLQGMTEEQKQKVLAYLLTYNESNPA